MTKSTGRDALDPRGLIAEAYKIEGITGAECRSIFLDWALGFDGDAREAVATLAERHGGQAADHPMTEVLREGLQSAPKRRGRRSGRRR